MSQFKTLDNLPADLTGKKVLVRADLNVPMADGDVSDDTRLPAAMQMQESATLNEGQTMKPRSKLRKSTT